VTIGLETVKNYHVEMAYFMRKGERVGGLAIGVTTAQRYIRLIWGRGREMLQKELYGVFVSAFISVRQLSAKRAKTAENPTLNTALQQEILGGDGTISATPGLESTNEPRIT